MNKVDYFGLITYMFGAQLKSDLNRYYLGTLWWFLEPCLYVVVFYFIFLNFRAHSEDFLFQLICGLTTWKWLTSIVNQGSSSIVHAKGLVSNFNIHPIIFPVVSFLTNSFKFLVVLTAILFLYLYKGVFNFAGAVPLLAWVFTSVLTVFSYQLVLSTVMPFLPDLRVIIGNLMMLLMFMSGVIVPIAEMPPHVQSILQWNPFVYLVDGARAVFLRGEALEYSVYLILIGIHSLILLLGLSRLTRLKGEFPKRLI